MKYIKFLKNVKINTPHVFILGLIILFWSLFDSIITYLTPVILSAHHFSNTQIGMIIGFSSLAGALFDILITKIFTKSSFRRFFIFLFIICMLYPLVLGYADSIFVFLIAMAMWGVYYDFYGFGIFDFISKYTNKDSHSQGFGIINMSKTLGQIIAPIIIGFTLIGIVYWKLFFLAWIFLGIAVILFVVLLWKLKNISSIINDTNNNINETNHHKKRSLLFEVNIWTKIARFMVAPLIVTFFLFTIEAFFWTLAPLFAESNMTSFGGFFLAAYGIPILISGWFIGKITSKYGNRRTAFYGLLIGSVLLSLFFLVSSNPWFIIILIFVAAMFFTIAMPSINGTYSDCIVASPELEKEIEGLEDLAFNTAYIFGPILAGLLSDLTSIPLAFSILGGAGAIIALSLILFASKNTGTMIKT